MLRPVLLRAAAATAFVLTISMTPVASAADTPTRIDLNVLVVTDGGSSAEAIRSALVNEGVPSTVIRLADAQRPVLTAAFLADTVNSTRRAKFQAVVLPNEAPAGLAQAELDALAAYQTSFGIRQVNAFTYPSARVGMNTPHYAGQLDGTTTQLTATALGGAFRNLRGPVPVENGDPAVWEAYGYLTNPLPDDPAAGTSFQPFLTGVSPDGSQQGVLAGVLKQGAREQLTFNFAYNAEQTQFKILQHGLISWLTKGIHFGHHRSYLSVHIDDVFDGDARWDTVHNCTPGDIDCQGEVPELPAIRMTPADVTKVVQWQQQHNFKLDMYFNAFGSDEVIAAQGSDPLTTALLQNKGQFRWANHTYSHKFLGCVQDTSVVPWKCATNPDGTVKWLPQAEIVTEINKNHQWGVNKGLALQRNEMLAGEHSGTKILPQQGQDNPNFVAALRQTGVTWIGLDASREPGLRQVGTAQGVPRYPISVYYNVGSRAEMTDEYNWIYTSRANGGSGICEDNPHTTTCIQPLGANGFDSYIVPTQVRLGMRFILGNDARPQYAHQSNIAEDRLLYPMVEGMLAGYRTAFAANAPIVNPRLSEAGTVMQRQNNWRAQVAAGKVSGYILNGRVHTSAPSGVDVPITVPEGTRTPGMLGGLIQGPLWGQVYAGERSDWRRSNGSAFTLVLPA
ncbi:Agd3-related carbohydrate-binding protein [Crossiella sp. CA198]|uniref:Agd3-related carbohydrate-binding protein n=1 Tax=Crossiella sp. CA198 TaxID=3455607 RepID=UPI003F8D2313